MALVFSEAGLIWCATWSFAGPFGGGIGTTIRLFSNNHTPSESDTVSSYTECSFTGYSSMLMNSWSTPAMSGGKAETTASNYVTTNSSGSNQTIYGYYVTDSMGNLLWAERDPAAPITLTPTSTYTVIPKCTVNNE